MKSGSLWCGRPRPAPRIPGLVCGFGFRTLCSRGGGQLLQVGTLKAPGMEEWTEGRWESSPGRGQRQGHQDDPFSGPSLTGSLWTRQDCGISLPTALSPGHQCPEGAGVRLAIRSRQCAGLRGLWASGACEVSPGEASASPARWGVAGFTVAPALAPTKFRHTDRDMSVSLVWLRSGWPGWWAWKHPPWVDPSQGRLGAWSGVLGRICHRSGSCLGALLPDCPSRVAAAESASGPHAPSCSADGGSGRVDGATCATSHMTTGRARDP